MTEYVYIIFSYLVLIKGQGTIIFVLTTQTWNYCTFWYIIRKIVGDHPFWYNVLLKNKFFKFLKFVVVDTKGVTVEIKTSVF